MARIHDRMPVIIAPEDYARWLDPAGTDQAGISRMLAPYPAELMRAYPVSSRVNDARNEDARLLEHVPVGALLIRAALQCLGWDPGRSAGSVKQRWSFLLSNPPMNRAVSRNPACGAGVPWPLVHWSPPSVAGGGSPGC
jgi:hypothetical protein